MNSFDIFSLAAINFDVYNFSPLVNKYEYIYKYVHE